MDKREIQRVERLAKKNLELSKRGELEVGNNKSPKKKERINIDKELDDRDAYTLFRDMKKREF
jgi:hypothetical protein